MTHSRLDRKNKNNQIRRLKDTIFNKANNLGLKGPNVYVLIEHNGKYDIFNSWPDEEWVPSDKTLVFSTSLPVCMILLNRRRSIITQLLDEALLTTFVDGWKER